MAQPLGGVYHGATERNVLTPPNTTCTKPAALSRAKRFGLVGLACAALAALAGCGDADGLGPDDLDPADGTAAVGSPIVNGQTDTADPAIVALTVWGQQYCSGTLITPTVVLTAAHCLPPNLSAEGINNYTDITVFFGNVVGQGGQTADVASGWTNPQWNDQQTAYDFGMIRLTSAGPPPPIPINEDTLGDSDIGSQIKFVGFGITSAGGNDNGIKRMGYSTIDAVLGAVFTAPMNPSGTCNGDSGGGTLMTRNGVEKIVGIHSRSDCTTQAIDTRVDHYKSDILAFTGQVSPGCGADGQCATGCAAPDPDCLCAADGFCTSACTAPASDPDCDPHCGQDGVCASGLCATPDLDCTCNTDGYCNPTCPGTDADCGPICPADGVCDPDCGNDPDCWIAAGVANQKYSGDLQSSGCSASPAQRGARPPWLALLLGSLGLALSRKCARWSRSSRRRRSRPIAPSGRARVLWRVPRRAQRLLRELLGAWAAARGLG